MSNVYYVYLHTDPSTKEVVYVGKGTGGRAWDVTRARGGHREHQAWMQRLMVEGYIPSDWVTVLGKSLTQEQAFSLEKQYLYDYGHVKFNRYSGERQHQAKLTDVQAIEIYTLAWTTDEKQGDIAKRYGVSRSAVAMIKTKKQWKTTLAGLDYANN